MLSPSTAILLLLTMFTAAAPHTGTTKFNSTKPPAFFLAGDSTTAIQSAGGGGWGVGFLSFVKSPAWGVDYGHNGATTVSFVDGGDWATVIQAVENNTESYQPFVTIQVCSCCFFMLIKEENYTNGRSWELKLERSAGEDALWWRKFNEMRMRGLQDDVFGVHAWGTGCQFNSIQFTGEQNSVAVHLS